MCQPNNAATLACSDSELMTKINHGIVDAFAELHDRHCDTAYRLACRDSGRPEDAVQNASVSVWNSRATYQPDRGAVAAWLLTVVRNRAIDTLRQHAGRVEAFDADRRLTNTAALDADPRRPSPGARRGRPSTHAAGACS